MQGTREKDVEASSLARPESTELSVISSQESRRDEPLGLARGPKATGSPLGRAETDNRNRYPLLAQRCGAPPPRNGLRKGTGTLLALETARTLEAVQLSSSV